MNAITTNSNSIERSLLVVVAAAVLLVGVGISASSSISIQTANAQVGSKSNVTGYLASGPNITGSLAIGPTIAKAIASQVHVSLANASTIAEKAVGTNSHAAAVRIGVVHGFLVYMALVLDSNNNFHGVIVDAGNGKVLTSTPMSFAALMRSGMGMMGNGGMMDNGGMMGNGIYH